MKSKIFNQTKRFPDTPGVYIMKDAGGNVLYVGKAGNLRRRVSSYFLPARQSSDDSRRLAGGRAHDIRIERLVGLIANIEYRQTDTAIEALILESALIKKLSPPFNVREKDDKSFLCVVITKEKFPRVLLMRGDKADKENIWKQFGPFTSAASLRYSLKILRRIFPWNTHAELTDPKLQIHPNLRIKKYFVDSDKFVDLHRIKPCFDYQIGLCPGTCIGAITRADYMKTMRNLVLFFEGKKKKVGAAFAREMKDASKRLEFERAANLRRRIFSLQHIEDVALISDSDSLLHSTFHILPTFRIEGYDISNISGDSAVGSMVVFTNGAPDKNEYRKFKIRTLDSPNDIGMLEEVFRRRFKNDWPLPNLMLVDGGVGQINAAKKILKEYDLKISLVGMVKGPDRNRTDIIGLIPKETDLKTLIRVRDEAHRFAITYHKKLRWEKFLR